MKPPPNRWIQPGEEHLVTEERTFFYNLLEERIHLRPEEPATPDEILAHLIDQTYSGGIVMIPGDHPTMPTLTEWARKGCAARAVSGIGPTILAPGVLGIEGTNTRIHVRAYVQTEHARFKHEPPVCVGAWEIR
jgi:hypothetical protein